MKPYSMLCFLREHPEIKRMKDFRQHKNTDTYSHCCHVALKSVWLIRCMGIKADMEAVIRGAMLHDFYLYAFYDENITPWTHSRKHPETALRNAEELFDLNRKEKNIIYSHMWPFNITHVPKCREAVVVNVADKLCAAEEIFLWGRANHKGFKNQRPCIKRKGRHDLSTVK